MAMGTPEYMAPEQAAGKAIDGRVDIYAVGAILYEMLTGDPPHHGANVMEILTKKATEPPQPPRQLNPDIPETLEAAVMQCLEREPDQRPQTMGALEYELNKSMKGRGSAVAAVLGLRATEDPPTNVWIDEGAKARPFDSPSAGKRRASSPGFAPPSAAAGSIGTAGPSGLTGALPLDATEGGKVRVANKKVTSRATTAPTIALDEKNNPDYRKTRRADSARGLWLGLAAILLGGGGYAAYHYQPWKTAPPPQVKPPVVVAPPAPPTKIEEPPTPKSKRQQKSEDDEKMSPAEIDRMLEWARRSNDGGRIIAPPGDNLKELLDRIEKADPNNAGAQGLRASASKTLSRKGGLALKRGRVDEAVQDLQSLAALKPDDENTKRQLARALRMRAEHMLANRKAAAAFTDVNASLELEPDDTTARIVLADILLAQGKHQEAADEYQRILDGKPADKRARRGLLAANAAKTKPVKKKHR